jgi:hypothetical protein
VSGPDPGSPGHSHSQLRQLPISQCCCHTQQRRRWAAAAAAAAGLGRWAGRLPAADGCCCTCCSFKQRTAAGDSGERQVRQVPPLEPGAGRYSQGQLHRLPVACWCCHTQLRRWATGSHPPPAAPAAAAAASGANRLQPRRYSWWQRAQRSGSHSSCRCHSLLPAACSGCCRSCC